MNPSDRLVSVTEAQCSNTRSSIQGCSGGFSSPNENKWSVLHLGLSNESQQPSSSRRAEPQKMNWLKQGALNSPRTVTDIPLYILDTVSHEELKQSTRYFFNVITLYGSRRQGQDVLCYFSCLKLFWTVQLFTQAVKLISSLVLKYKNQNYLTRGLRLSDPTADEQRSMKIIKNNHRRRLNEDMRWMCSSAPAVHDDKR